MTSRSLAIHCAEVTKTYGEGPAEVAALRGADLDVYQGELLMLVGPSGCGKTTLLSIIAAILEQDAGTCEVFGNDLKSMTEEQRRLFRSVSIGFVFQIFNLLPALTPVENVSVPLLLQGVQRKAAEQRAQSVLESVGLAERFTTLPAKLSGGEQQRVAIARALVHNPRLIICDEPTSNLDHENGQAMMEILRGVADHSDRTLIVVTHDARILEYADRIVHMDDGRITGKP